MTLFEQLQQANIQTDSHRSDLYFPVTEQTSAMVNEYKFKSNVTTFTSQIDGKRWYDAPFAFDPYWDAVERRSAMVR